MLVSDRTICVTQSVSRESKCFLNPCQPVLLDQNKQYTTKGTPSARVLLNNCISLKSLAFGKSSVLPHQGLTFSHCHIAGKNRRKTLRSLRGCSKARTWLEERTLYNWKNAWLYKMIIFHHILFNLVILTLSHRSQILAVPSLLAEINMSFEG